MATTYLKMAGITGPVDPTPTLTVPPGAHPDGFGVRDSFGVQAYTTGLERQGEFLHVKTGTLEPTSTIVPSPFMLYLDDTPMSNLIWKMAATSATFTTVCLVQTRPAMGGLTTRWIPSYWILTGAAVFGLRSSHSDGDSQAFLEISLTPKAVLQRQFRAPSGGALGAPVADFTWNYSTGALT